jgi:osmotically-inducible protein OsmY
MRLLSLLLSVLLALLLLAGCENRTPRPKTDAALTEKVKVALEHEARLGSDRVEIDSNSGVVMLKGLVRDDATKQRVQEVAKKVEGVTWVQNQVAVAPKEG